MKSLGILAIAMLVVPFVGTSAPANDDENFGLLLGIEHYESLTGETVNVEDVQVLASADFKLPLGATGVQASYNTVTGVLDVVPISAMPDSGAQAGCVLDSGSFGFQTSPIGTSSSGGCSFFGSHPGGVTAIRMICTNSQYCFDIVFGNGFFQIFCQFNTVTVVSVDPVTGLPTSLGTGFCQVFAFVFQPAALWPNYFAYNFVNPPGALTVGLTNY